MPPDGTKNEPPENGKQAAKARLRQAIQAAVASGLGWSEIVRLLAEHGPTEPTKVPPKGHDGNQGV
jgi:hypothetical protein